MLKTEFNMDVATRVWKEEGFEQGKIEVAIALVNDGDSVEHAARIAGITVDELEQYL